MSAAKSNTREYEHGHHSGSDIQSDNPAPPTGGFLILPATQVILRHVTPGPLRYRENLRIVTGICLR